MPFSSLTLNVTFSTPSFYILSNKIKNNPNRITHGEPSDVYDRTDVNIKPN